MNEEEAEAEKIETGDIEMTEGTPEITEIEEETPETDTKMIEETQEISKNTRESTEETIEKTPKNLNKNRESRNPLQNNHTLREADLSQVHRLRLNHRNLLRNLVISRIILWYWMSKPRKSEH